ncbi:MAG TPA: hypothetical protein VEU33_26275 [Archangium sp.]|nr:hypothetical protein [Archangium sp.]
MALSLAGCGTAAGEPEPPAVAQGVRVPQAYKTLDASLLEVSATAPGFGGLYHDEQGRLVIRLMRDFEGPAARRAIASVFGPEMIPAAGVVYAPARFSFASLKALQERVTPDILSQAGTVMTDVDEKGNRVVVGVESSEVRQRILARLEALGAPPDMVEVVEMSPIMPTSTVQAGWRPITGGLQLETSGKYCTLGFAAMRGTTLGFVTNSHCTQTQGGVESTLAYQPTIATSNLAGTELVDPLYTSGGSCPAGRVCRRSDSAFFRADTTVNPLIAATSGAFNLSVSSWLAVPSKTLSLAQGQTVFKTGRTTGTTSGTIEWACVTVNSGGTPHTYFCNYIATNSTQNGQGGDSGSPVYFLSGSNATLAGLMWGAGSNPWNFSFSPLAAVQDELGILPYCQGNTTC